MKKKENWNGFAKLLSRTLNDSIAMQRAREKMAKVSRESTDQVELDLYEANGQKDIVTQRNKS